MSEEQNIEDEPNQSNQEPFKNVNEISSQQNIEPPQTENMEVHHHPDLHHKPKKWKEYFLEFLMIFIAVTLGFFAENIREYFAEKNVTQQYLKSMQVELIHNKSVFQYADSLYKARLPVEDSIVKIFIAKNENADLHLMARLIYTSRLQYMPPIETSAYNQLVNSGGLKYINNTLKDSLSKYESLIEEFKSYNTAVNNYIITSFPGITSIEDLSDYVHSHESNHIFIMSPYPELTDRERRQITNYYTYHFERTSGNREHIDDLIYTQVSLLGMIQKETEHK